MNQHIRNITYIIVIFLCGILALIYEKGFFAEISEKNIAQHTQRYIDNIISEIDDITLDITNDIEAEKDLWELDYNNKFLIFITSSKSLKYWNNNRICSENIPFSSDITCKYIDNAWFLYKSVTVNQYRVDVLFNIKNSYSINNKYFNNDKTRHTKLSYYSISETFKEDYSIAYSKDKQPIFYFNKVGLNDHNKLHSTLSSVFFMLLYLITLIFFSAWHSNTKVNLISLCTFAAIYFVLIYCFKFVPIYYMTEFFSYEIFLAENFSCKIGILALAASFWIVFCYTASKQITYFEPNKIQTVSIVVILLFTFYIILQAYINVVKTIPVNLQFYRIRRFDSISLWIFSIFIFFVAGWVRLSFAGMISFRKKTKKHKYPFFALGLCIPIIIKAPLPLLSGAILLIVIDLIIKRKDKFGRFKFINMLVIVVIMSLAVTTVTEYYNSELNEAHKKDLLHSLPTPLLYERDYIIEEYLVNIWDRMKQDKVLADTKIIKSNTAKYYTNYLRKNYFNNKLKEYDMQVIVCTPDNYLNIEGYTASPNCYEYFNNRLYKEGKRIKNTGFYWQNNNNGRVSYLGWLKILEGTYMETSIIIELESPILTEGRGYPEILRDNASIYSALPEHNSFARYSNGKLINSIGEYIYPPNDKWLGDFDDSYKRVDFDYNTNYCRETSKGHYVVITEEKTTLIHSLYAYIYNFLMIYLSFLIIHIFTHKHKIVIQNSISNNIRFTIFSILLFCFTVIGTISLLYPINLYKDNQNNIITQKSESFLNTLTIELQDVSDINNVSRSYLQNLLQTLSNILSNDIHIYDLNGKLYTSSRPQLFKYKLQSNIISPNAYKTLKYENISSHVFDEKIGNNEYKAGYYLISNADEDPIAYINIPFFSSQLDLRKNIADLIVLLFNIYIIIIFFVVIFTFIFVNRITKPLLIIQDGLSRMRLGSNDKLEYKSKDEIGELVNKYNEMVDELNVSAQHLAKSEREVAWKSMARQIAHEIKNPLTPMKLSIQYLARTKSVSPDKFDDYFDKTANTLIEQIDNLSNIATSFSTFAKISDGEEEPIQVNERLLNIITLYEQSGSKITYHKPSKEYIVVIDKDHFRQIFNNLIKNALQAIPKDRNGEISVFINENKNMLNINVKDNGAGIKEEMRDKIFQPNFTTKNSGMGLGLAISQKMAKNAGGNITFISEEGKGTTFIVSLPITNITEETPDI